MYCDLFISHTVKVTWSNVRIVLLVNDMAKEVSCFLSKIYVLVAKANPPSLVSLEGEKQWEATCSFTMRHSWTYSRLPSWAEPHPLLVKTLREKSLVSLLPLIHRGQIEPFVVRACSSPGASFFSLFFLLVFLGLVSREAWEIMQCNWMIGVL